MTYTKKFESVEALSIKDVNKLIRTLEFNAYSYNQMLKSSPIRIELTPEFGYQSNDSFLVSYPGDFSDLLIKLRKRSKFG